MIRPPGLEGVVFSEGFEGDMRQDESARRHLSEAAGAPREWATVRQAHGNLIKRVHEPGPAGTADGLWTTQHNLAVSVFTADCFGVVLMAPDAVGVAHAGWRGSRSGVVERLRGEMFGAGHQPTSAAVGPGIGHCCFEVGPEVLREFPGSASSTSWKTESVDLRAVLKDQLAGLDTWFSRVCTYHDEGFFSHRSNKTEKRLAALGWLA